MLRPSNSFGRHAETEDIQHEDVYRGAAAHGELSLQVGVSPQVCVIQGTPSTAASSRSPLVLTVSTCYKVVGGSLSYLQVPGESPGYFFIHSIRSPHWPRSSASLSTRATQGHAHLLLLVRPQTSHFLYNVRLPTQSVRRLGKANGTHGAQHLLRHG